MLDTNESVRHSALELTQQERADATTAYLKSFMFKGRELLKQKTTYDAPTIGTQAPTVGVNTNNIRTNMAVGAAIMNPMLTENIKNNTGVNFSPDNPLEAYTSGIGTDKEYSVDLSSEVAVIRAIGPNFFAYNPGYDYYGPAFTGSTVVYEEFATHLLTGSSYVVKDSAEGFHKWTFLHEVIDIRERLNTSINLSNSAKLTVHKDRPITNLCFSHASQINDPMADQSIGLQALSFSVFDNSRFNYDPIVGGPYRSDEADACIYMSGIQAVVDTTNASPASQRSKHEAGLSWMGYQYAISTKSISVSNDAFESVTEVIEPFTGYHAQSTAAILDQIPNVSVYPTESGVIIHPNYGPDYIVMKGPVVDDIIGQNTYSHFLKWDGYTARMGPDDATHGYGKYITYCEVNGESSILPVGVDFQNTTTPQMQVSYWMASGVGKNMDNTLPATGQIAVALMGANLDAGSPTLNLSVTAIALDRTRTIVSPLREAYCSTDDGHFCIAPVTGYIENNGQTYTIPAIMVIHKETCLTTIVDIADFIASPTPEQVSTPCWGSTMIDVAGHIGYVGPTFQYVLKPKSDPRLPQSWVKVNMGWLGSFVDPGVDVPDLEDLEDTKYTLHDTPFSMNLGSVYKYGSTDPASSQALGVETIYLDSAMGMYDCYTVTDYARYPALPTALRGSSVNMIAYPILRNITMSSSEEVTTLFPEEPSWEGFYFSTGLMRLEIPILRSLDTMAASESLLSGYSSKYSEGSPQYPSGTTIFPNKSRPKVTGGFCILPKAKLIGETIHYAPGA